MAARCLILGWQLQWGRQALIKSWPVFQQNKWDFFVCLHKNIFKVYSWDHLQGTIPEKKPQYLHPLNSTNTSASIIRCIHGWPLFLWQSIFIIWLLWERQGDVTVVLIQMGKKWTSYSSIFGYLALCVTLTCWQKTKKSLVSAAAILTGEAKEDCLFPSLLFRQLLFNQICIELQNHNWLLRDSKVQMNCTLYWLVPKLCRKCCNQLTQRTHLLIVPLEFSVTQQQKSYHCEISNMCIKPFSYGSCNQLFCAAWFFVESGSSCTVGSWNWDWSISKFLGSSDPEFLTCNYKDWIFFFLLNVGESESGFYFMFTVLFLHN